MANAKTGVTTTNNRVAAKQAGLKALVVSMEGQIKKALPSVLTPERFTRMVMTALSTKPELQQCTPESFLGAMMQAAQLGVEPNTPLGQAYLIPYKNKGRLECQFQLGYKGLLDLAYRSGEVSVVDAQAVHENDEFSYEYGLDPKLKFKPSLKDRGPVIAYYAMFKTKDGGYNFAVMSREDVENHAKQYSKAAATGYSPWTSNFDAMAKKGLSITTPIPTDAGWTTMGEIEVGDTVFDMYGNKTKVIATSEIKNLDCFRINFSGGESLVCDNEHRWVAFVGDSNARRDLKNQGWNTLTVNELYDASIEGKRILVPTTPTLVCDEIDLPIDPWFLGYWIGNGGSGHASVCCDVGDQEYVVNRINRAGYYVGAIRKDKRSNAVTIGVKSNVQAKLRDVGVLNHKHIPMLYLRAGIKQRMELLRGLMDSDGCIASDVRARASYSSVKEHIAKEVKELLISLGESPNMSSYLAKGFGVVAETFTVSWQPSFCPAEMPRKAENYRERIVGKYRSVKSIERIISVPTRCIAVDAESKTYLAGETMIPTHNTVLKQVLKYAPLKSDFVKEVAADSTIKTTIEPNMTDLNDETVIDVTPQPPENPDPEPKMEEPPVVPFDGD